MKIEISRFNSEAAPQSNVSLGEYNKNDFAAIVPVIPGQIGGREASIVSAKALHKALGVGMEYDQRKAELIRLSQRWLAEHLGANHA